MSQTAMTDLCKQLRQQAAEAALSDLHGCADAMMQAADTIERLRFAGRNVIRAAETRTLTKRHVEQLRTVVETTHTVVPANAAKRPANLFTAGQRPGANYAANGVDFERELRRFAG